MLTLLLGRPAKPMKSGKIGVVRTQNSETTESINIKFAMSDYVGDITPLAFFKIVAATILGF